MQNKRILITGASKGLGAVAAVAFAERGASLVLLARSQDKLESVRRSCVDPERHLCISADLLQVEEIQLSVLKAKEFLGGIDVVLHAAGGGLGFKDDLLMPGLTSAHPHAGRAFRDGVSDRPLECWIQSIYGNAYQAGFS